MLGMAACSSHRQNATSAGAPAKRSAEVKNLAAGYTPWTTLYAPVNVSMQKPASFSFSGRATMEYGHYIHISLRVLGMEAGVIYIDNDSAYIIDKFHKRAVTAPLAALRNNASITLEDIQGILIGQAVYPGEGILHDNNRVQTLFSVSSGNDGTSILTPRRVPGNVSWYMTLSPLPALTSLDVDADGKGQVKARYSDITETPAGNVAASMDLLATVADHSLDMSINWSLNKAEWNSSRKASLPDLSDYKRISYTDLAKGLKF